MAANKPKLGISNLKSSVLGAVKGIKSKFTKPEKVKVTLGKGGEGTTIISQPSDNKELNYVSQQLAETTSILTDIGNALALDFANRITENKRRISNRRRALARAKFFDKENTLEGVKKVGGFVKNTGEKLLQATGLGGIFGKIWKFIKFLFVGIAATTLIKWIKDGGIGRLKDTFKSVMDFVKPLFDKVKAGFGWVAEKLKPIWDPIWSGVKYAGTQIQRALRALTGFVIKLAPFAKLAGTKVMQGVGWTINRALDAPNRWGRRWEGLKNWGSGVVEKMFPEEEQVEAQKGSDSVNKLFGHKPEGGGKNVVTRADIKANIMSDVGLSNMVASSPSVEFINLPDVFMNREINEPPVKLTEIKPVSSINTMNRYMDTVPEILGIVEV